LAHIKETVALREIKTACKVLGWRDAKSETITIKKLSSGPGNCLNVMAEFNNVTAVTTAHGAHGVTSERVARNAAKTMGKFLNSGASIDHQLADQLLLPLALAGEGSYLTTPPTNHMLTNREVIEKFLPVEINFAETSNHLYQTTISHNK
ncbi:MAG: RNA 3'-terminal phosphate cyclase, partial [Akkermansiaceae bacterium]